MQVFSTRTCERAVRKLLGETARREMEASIASAPGAAPVIRGTGGIRKLRWAGSGRGKRGGIRTIYFYRLQHTGANAALSGDEQDEQLEAVGVAGDGMAADAALLRQVIVQKGRKMWGEISHGRLLW